jgi:hypothetical protein
VTPNATTTGPEKPVVITPTPLRTPAMTSAQGSPPRRQGGERSADNHDAAVDLIAEHLGAHVVGEYENPDDARYDLPREFGYGRWGPIPRWLRLLRSAAEDRARDRARERSRERPPAERATPGPRCEVCGAPAVEPPDPDATELMCGAWWRRCRHNCEICRRRVGEWRGHGWVCGACVARVAINFRAELLDREPGR